METENYETSAESVSNFMRWIERKLEQEVESIERFEKQADPKEDTVITHKGIDPRLSDIERRLVIRQVHCYRNEGMSAIAACKLAGLHNQTYNKWRRLLNIPIYKRQ
jgi:hypothetical protein